jgi:hypothetical protein
MMHNAPFVIWVIRAVTFSGLLLWALHFLEALISPSPSP